MTPESPDLQTVLKLLSQLRKTFDELLTAERKEFSEGELDQPLEFEIARLEAEFLSLQAMAESQQGGEAHTAAVLAELLPDLALRLQRLVLSQGGELDGTDWESVRKLLQAAEGARERILGEREI